MCCQRNLYAGQEAIVRTGHGTTVWFQIGTGVCQGCILSPCLFNFYAEYIIRNAGLDEAWLQVWLVVAMRSGKQTHSEGQCRSWSAGDYAGGPKAESPFSQGPRPAFMKTLYTLSVPAQTHLPKFPETSLNKGKERCNQS